VDTDGDGIQDVLDNCSTVANADQRDVDYDGLGSVCDADYNNDNTVSLNDFSALRAAFGTATGDVGFDANIDTNNSGQIDLGDFSLLRSQFGGAPGPGGRGCETAIVGGPTGQDCPASNLPL